MLKSIQAGRGVAAVAVLLFHLSLLVEHETGTGMFWQVLQYGNRGVDFFFVLSGFIILHAHSRDVGEPGRWRSFVRKRFVRVYPIYWVFTGAVVGAVMVGMGAIALPTDPPGWITTFSLVRFSGVAPPLAQAWTLFHEVLFYAAFSCLILNRTLGYVVLSIWMAAVLINFHYPANQHSPLSVLLSAHNLNFILGMAAYLVSRRIGGMPALLLAGTGAAIFIATTAFAHPVSHPSAIGYGIGCAFLIAGLAAWERGRTISVPGALLLGNASYSIYLTHEVSQEAGARIVGIAGLSSPLVMFVFVGTFSLVGGVLAYLAVEKPLLGLLRKRT